MGSVTDFVMGIIPTSMVDAFAKGDVLQVLLVAVLFGFALHKFGGRGTLVFDFIEKISHVLFSVVGAIMKVARSAPSVRCPSPSASTAWVRCSRWPS
jgi:aerobic C4-dicarboxylate transport protein